MDCKHRQFGYWTAAILALASTVTVLTLLAVDGWTRTQQGMIIVVTAIVLLLIALLFHSLTIKANGGQIRFWVTEALVTLHAGIRR